MNQLQRMKDDLLEKRLWPFVALLVVALVAVPLVLRPDTSEGTAPAPAPAADGPSPEATLAAASSVLGLEPPVTAITRGAPRGDRRDPFAAPAAPKPDASAASSASPSGGGGAATRSATPRPQPAASSGSSSPSPSPAPGPRTTPDAPSTPPEDADPAPAVTEPADDRPTVYRLLHTDLRFDGETLTDVVRLRPLPGARRPAAVFLGPTTGGSGAAFALSGGVEVGGDGRCRPRRRLCSHLILRLGEQATLTVGEREHTLRLLRVRVERTTSQAKAERFYARQSERGRCVLDVLDYLGYDAETGTVAPHHDNRECEYVFHEDRMTVGAR